MNLTGPCASFGCPQCGARFLLPHESLGQMFADPALQRISAPFLAFPCRTCKSVEAYSLQGDSPYKRELDTTVVATLPENPVTLSGWLQCVGEGCMLLVPLFVQWSETTTEAERVADTSTWKWENLKCPQGHAIHSPIFAADPSE